jgi:hypothetical protein
MSSSATNTRSMSRADDLVRRVEAVCRMATGPVGVERAVAGVIREAVPFDAWCVLTVDPACALPTGGYHDEGVPAHHVPCIAELDARGEDAMALTDLARRRTRVATLSASTRATSIAAPDTGRSSSPPGSSTNSGSRSQRAADCGGRSSHFVAQASRTSHLLRRSCWNGQPRTSWPHCAASSCGQRSARNQ